MGQNEKACQNCLIDFNNDREVICVRCGQNVPLPELNKKTLICKKCSEIPKLPCVICFNEFDAILLNADGICKDCVNIEYCKSCGAALNGQNGKKPSDAVDGFCGDCVDETPNSCMGCGKDFMPTWDRDLFCEKCDKQIRKGICIRCKRSSSQYKFTDEHGICNICIWETKTSKHLCAACEKNTVRNQGDYCSNCMSYKCAHCGIKRVHSEFDVCNSCKDAFGEPDFEDKEK